MKLTQARIDAIANRYHPEGWRVFESNRDSGVANYPRRTIRVPFIRDPYSLFVFLHECAHVHLRHWGDGASTLHREEFEAERWGIEIARQNNVPLSAELIRDSKIYVRRCIEKDRKMGVKIEPHIARWAKG